MKSHVQVDKLLLELEGNLLITTSGKKDHWSKAADEWSDVLIEFPEMFSNHFYFLNKNKIYYIEGGL